MGAHFKCACIALSLIDLQLVNIQIQKREQKYKLLTEGSCPLLIRSVAHARRLHCSAKSVGIERAS